MKFRCAAKISMVMLKPQIRQTSLHTQFDEWTLHESVPVKVRATRMYSSCMHPIFKVKEDGEN